MPVTNRVFAAGCLSWNLELDDSPVGVVRNAEVLAHDLAANPGLNVIGHFVDKFDARYGACLIGSDVEVEKLSCLIAFCG